MNEETKLITMENETDIHTIFENLKVSKNASVYTQTYLCLGIFEFWYQFFSSKTLKTASGRPECEGDMDDAAFMDVLNAVFQLI